MEEKRYLQEILDTIHKQFINAVSKERKMPFEEALKLSDGRIYLGQQAKGLKLIDKIGTFYDAVEDLKNALGIKGKPKLVYGKRPFSLLKWLISSVYQEIYLKFP
jgi:protease-4